MRTERSAASAAFQAVSGRAVAADFAGGSVTSDAGAPLLRYPGFLERLRFEGRFAVSAAIFGFAVTAPLSGRVGAPVGRRRTVRRCLRCCRERCVMRRFRLRRRIIVFTRCGIRREGRVRVHCNLDAADADADPRGDLERFEARASACGDGEAGVGEAEAAQGADQHIGRRREPQAEAVRADAVRRGAIGERVELALLDAILHLAAWQDRSSWRLRASCAPAASEAAAKRGLASPWVRFALPTTRRSRLRPPRVDRMKSTKRRALRHYALPFAGRSRACAAKFRVDSRAVQARRVGGVRASRFLLDGDGSVRGIAVWRRDETRQKGEICGGIRRTPCAKTVAYLGVCADYLSARPSEQQSAGVRGRRPAVEIRNNRPSRNRLNGAGRRATLRSHRGTPCPDISP